MVTMKKKNNEEEELVIINEDLTAGEEKVAVMAVQRELTCVCIQNLIL